MNDKCIYYKNIDSLTFKGQEHIFPASIGGIKKLPTDYVSKEANDYFSKLENHMLHGSLILTLRSFFGPSKRKDKKEGTRIVTVMEKIEENDLNEAKVELGYIREGVPYSIPQVLIREGKLKFSVSPSDGIEKLNQFVDKMKNEYLRVIRRYNDLLGNNELIVGYAGNVFYVAHNSNKNLSDEDIQKIIKQVGALYKPSEKLNFTENHVETSFSLSETEDEYRVFAKIAFNVLADIKGKEYVLDNDFDKLRNWLMGEEDPDYNDFLPRIDVNDVMQKVIPEKSHWCVLLNVKGDLCAVVGIYNIISRGILLARNRGGDISYIDGMICDWKNNKEYRVIDFILNWIKENNLLQPLSEN